LIYGAFQCEVKGDYITVSRLLLVPVSKCLWLCTGNGENNCVREMVNWGQLLYPNLSWLQSCVLLPNFHFRGPRLF